MTTVQAGRQTPSADFPITWDSPEQEQATWFQDVMHTPLPVTPLGGTLFQPAFAEGAGRGFDKLKLPLDRLDVTIQNGYLYMSRHLATDDPSEMEVRLAEGQQLTMQLGATVLKDWRETFEPQVLDKAAKILAFDYDGSSVEELARYVVDLQRQIADVWEIHMRVNIPPMGAVFGMEEMLSAALGEEIIPQARQMLQGFDNKSIETGRAMWALSRWIREDEALHKALLASRVRDGAVVVEDTPRTDEFRRRWADFLDTYGWRSDRFAEIGHPSWREDPSTALTQLKAYLAVDDNGDPFASHARQAAERDQIASEIEARLPEEMRPMFRGILHVAQQYIPIAEDHNFTIDQKFTVVVRHCVLQLGRKLTAAGALSDPEEVFFLTLDEIRNIADGGSTDGLSALARQRQRERVRQASMRAPVMIGAPIPEDAPPDPIITKFFGVGQVPSDKDGIVTGYPCSNGVVTGVAKVVRTLDEAGKLEPGDVLVCRMTMPAWTPLFGVASAVVADSGGPLSHCAIVAREYGIPCVAGTVNGTDVLQDGMRVRVDGAAGMVTVLGDAPRG